MVKYMGIWSLKPGFDPDETFKLWRERHTLWAKAKLKPEVRKYTIARVIDTLNEAEHAGLWVECSVLRRMNSWLRGSPTSGVLLFKRRK